MIFLAALLATLLIVFPAAPETWERPLTRVTKSMVRLGWPGQPVWCSGFVVNEESGFVITADHCTPPDGLWETDAGLQGRLVKNLPEQDLALVAVPSLQRPALKRRTKRVSLGQEVAALGYGGTPEPLATFGWVSHPLLAPPWGEARPGLIVFGNYIAGMSGGPIVDRDGRVVSVVQQGGHAVSQHQDLGYGVAPSVLAEWPGPDYWR